MLKKYDVAMNPRTKSNAVDQYKGANYSRHLGVIRVLQRKAHRAAGSSFGPWDESGSKVAHSHGDFSFTTVWRVVSTRLKTDLENRHGVTRSAKHADDLARCECGDSASRVRAWVVQM